jgi:cobalt-zinc-cadmium efflux system outer membrane protein
MTSRFVWGILIVAVALPLRAVAQSSEQRQFADRYVDRDYGLSLAQAIAHALTHEPSLQAARSEIEVARGMRDQASLRPNPSASFDWRQEPAGTDNQAMIGLQWPLDLFRKGPRVAVADREVQGVELSIADRERLLAAEARARYGDVLVEIRALAILDELVAATRRQHELLSARVQEGATPPLERDLLDVEVRRLESERLLKAGEAEAALVALKRALGMSPDAILTVKETLDDVVTREMSVQPPVPEGTTALDQRADVRQAASRIELAEAKLARSQSEGRFDLSVVGNYSRMDTGFPQRGFAGDGSIERVRGQFQYLSAGVMVTVPLLNRRQGDIAAAKAERAGAAAALDGARLTAVAELAGARARDDYARRAVNAYGGAAKTLARQNVTIVSQSYELGRLTVFDVLAAQLRYFEFERGYADALKAAYEARTELDRAVGGVR